jgi:hypothetical protein
VDLNCNIYFRANMTCNAKRFRENMTYNKSLLGLYVMVARKSLLGLYVMVPRNSLLGLYVMVPRSSLLGIDYAVSTHFWTGNRLEHIYLYCTLHIPHVYNKTMYEFGVMYAFKTLL